MAEGPGRMDTGEDVSTAHQVYATEAPEINTLKVHKYNKDVLVLCTKNRNDMEIAQNRAKILQQKGLVQDVMSLDHTQPSEAVTEGDKNTLLRAIFESKKILMIVSRYLAESAYLEVLLDFIYKLSEQRKQPMLIVYKLPDTDLSKFPRRLRSGTSLVTIAKDKYTTKKAINHNDEDKDMELLYATEDTQVKGFELQNVAPGLVCGFIHNFLQFKLPHLDRAIRDASEEMSKWNVEVPEENIFKKMIILLPESCTFPSSFDDLHDDNIQYVLNTSLPDSPHVKAKFTKDQGGQKGRDYSSSLCSVTGNVLKKGGLEKITYVCVAEFATPLSNLNMMWKRSDLYGFTKDRKEAEYNEFIDNLGQILECFPECNDKCILLEYNDEAEDNIPISERIIRTIQEDIVRQKNIGMVEEASRP